MEPGLEPRQSNFQACALNPEVNPASLARKYFENSSKCLLLVLLPLVGPFEYSGGVVFWNPSMRVLRVEKYFKWRIKTYTQRKVDDLPAVPRPPSLSFWAPNLEDCPLLTCWNTDLSKSIRLLSVDPGEHWLLAPHQMQHFCIL